MTGSLAVRRRANVIVWTTLVLAMVISAFPVVWTFLTSLKPRTDTFSVPPVWFFAPEVESYKALFSEYQVGGYLANSAVVAVVATTLTVILGSIAAYAFSVFFFRGRGVLLVVVILLRMLPPIVLVTPLYEMLHRLGIFDTQIALIAIYTGLNLPFAIWMMKGFFDEVPRELVEAGRIDGCAEFSIFRRLVAPVSLPGFFATAVFTFVLAWNDFIFAFMLTSVEARTLPVLASTFIGDQGVQWGRMTAASSFILLPVIAFSVLAQKWLVRGLTAGGVKG